MSEWMVTVDTPPAVAEHEGVLLAFSDSLDAELGATAAASMNSDTGVLSATFMVEGEGVQEAVNAAVGVFNAALERVGLPSGNLVHVDAEPIEDRELAIF